MKRFVVFAVAFFANVLSAMPVSADARVLCLGDSNTWIWSPYKASYCDVLDQMRDDLETVNEGVPGDTSVGAFDRLKGILANEQFDVVIIFIGTNDVQWWSKEPNQPSLTVRTIRKMSRYARTHGARYTVVMTPMPAMTVRDAFCKEVSKKMVRYSWAPHRRVGFIDLYHLFESRWHDVSAETTPDANGWNNAMTYDGVHIMPVVAAEIANRLASIIPAQ